MATPSSFETTLNECYNKFYNRVFHIDICPKKMIMLTINAMECVEDLPYDGCIQKSMVIKMLQRFINKSEMNDQSKKYYLKLIENGMIGAVIEAVIASTKNKVGVNSPIVVKKSGCF